MAAKRSGNITKSRVQSSAVPLSIAAPATLTRQIITASLLLFGVLFWLAIGGGRGIGTVRWIIIIGSAGIALLPPVARRINAIFDRSRHPTPEARRWAALLIGLAAAGYFIVTAVLQHRDLFPKTHDDSSYFLQMQMLARGRLWMPAHPLADFFDSFYILVRPVYASQYFPGTAILYVPTVWLNLPTWVMPVFVSGAIVGLIYLVITELIDGAAGAIAALWVISLSWFRMVSILLMSQGPALLFGLLMVWTWLRWRRKKSWGWILALGVLGGWAAITRPVDAICYALPVGIAIAYELRRLPIRHWVTTAILLLAGAAPFLAVQLIFDKGVTGNYLQTPFQLYLDEDAPGSGIGFHAYDPAAHPQSALPDKKAYYRDWVVPFIRLHQPGQLFHAWLTRWFPEIVDTTTPARIQLPLMLAGLLGLTDRRRWVLWSTFPLFVLLYLFYPIFLEHYATTVIPAAILMALLGVNAISGAWPRVAPQLNAALAVLIVVSCLTSLWEINQLIVNDARKQIIDETFFSDMLRRVHDLYGQRAVVLFRRSPGLNWSEEPVYNSSVAWPDDAEIIRAHDLGPRDWQIVDYYAKRQPDRVFFVWDLGTGVLRRIGSAGDLGAAQRDGKNLDALLHPH